MRFVVCGGATGVASSFAVTALAACLPWVVANALVTVVSTLAATELHARFTFGAGRRASRLQHMQSAGSASAAYAVTCMAMAVLHQLTAAPGALTEQLVYLSASALAGAGRFLVLHLVVFAGGARTKNAAPATPGIQAQAQVQAREGVQARERVQAQDRAQGQGPVQDRVRVPGVRRAGCSAAKVAVLGAGAAVPCALWWRDHGHDRSGSRIGTGAGAGLGLGRADTVPVLRTAA
ncbi:GtrA domain-containing protein [Streptomyces apricus]|uniref:hypothetical protein n=1 Tax=Streptomyces apricus TaxID=1828112 RepID=UPI0038B446E6